MKLFTAVIPHDQLQRVTEALSGAGIVTTSVASAEAPGITGQTSLLNRGTQYRDDRCVRLEVLASDLDAEIVSGVLSPAGVRGADGPVVWSTEVAAVIVAAARDRSGASS